MGEHAAFVLGSYGVATVTVLGLILWVLIDARGRQRDLKRLEEAGIRRRSATASAGEAA